MAATADLVWQLVRNNSCFLKKQKKEPEPPPNRVEIDVVDVVGRHLQHAVDAVRELLRVRVVAQHEAQLHGIGEPGGLRGREIHGEPLDGYGMDGLWPAIWLLPSKSVYGESEDFPFTATH